MDTLTTADALLIVDLTDAVLVVADGIDRTRLTARTLQMRDGTIRTGVRTHTTLLTLVRIDVRSRLGHGDRTEAAAVLARLTEAETAVIGYRISGQRTLLTGRIDDLYDVRILLRRVWICIQVLRKTDSPSQNLTLLVYTAAPCCVRSR